MSTTIERRYTLHKIKPGDYILPSNDGQVVWRISRYQDGPSSGLDWPRDRYFWGVWRWNGSLDSYVDRDWDRWDFWEGMHMTRAEAVEAALRVA